MPKKFSIYSAVLVFLMAVANLRGYTFTDIFRSEGKAQRSANRYHK